MKTNPQLTVSDLYTGILPVIKKAVNRHGYCTYFLNFGETYSFCPKIIIRYPVSTETLMLLQALDKYERLCRFGKDKPSKQLNIDFKKTMKVFKVKLHNTSPSGEWYVLD